MILRMPRNAYPLSPALKAPKTRSIEAFNSGVLGTAPKATEGTGNYAGGVQIFPLAKKANDAENTDTENTQEATDEKPAE